MKPSRSLLLVFSWLLALLPADAPASIPRGTLNTLAPRASWALRADPAAAVDAAPLTLHLDGGYEGGEVRYGFLVRQNPWSKFDPFGLNETFGWNNWFANWVLPDPKASWNEGKRQAGVMVDPDKGWIDRAGGACGWVGNGISVVVDCIPGIGGAKRKLVASTAEHAVEKVGGQVTKHPAEQGAERLAQKAEVAVERTAKQTAEKNAERTASEGTHGHHSDPKFMGGEPNQKLTDMPADKHRGRGTD